MNVIVVVSLIFGVTAWFIHLIFIGFAIANKGKIAINYNYYKEMYIELVLMFFLFIVSIIGVIEYIKLM